MSQSWHYCYILLSTLILMTHTHEVYDKFDTSVFQISTKATPSQSLVSGHPPAWYFEKSIYGDYNDIHNYGVIVLCHVMCTTPLCPCLKHMVCVLNTCVYIQCLLFAL